MVVARGELGELVRREDRDGVFGCAEAETGGVARDLAGVDVVLGFGAEEEAVVTEDGVGGDGRTLESQRERIIT